MSDNCARNARRRKKFYINLRLGLTLKKTKHRKIKFIAIRFFLFNVRILKKKKKIFKGIFKTNLGSNKKMYHVTMCHNMLYQKPCAQFWQ